MCLPASQTLTQQTAMTLTGSLSRLASRAAMTFRKVWLFYYDGFRNMTIGKTLWAIILLKLFIFFAVIKLFFFPDLLGTMFDNDYKRADHVRKELTRPR